MTSLRFGNLFFAFILLMGSVGAWNGWKLKHIFPTKLAQNTLKTLTLTQILLPLAANAVAVQYKLPPIDLKDEHRCELVSSSIGQANAARDKLYDLRQCNLKGQSAQGKDLSGMIAADADFTAVSFKDAQISKAYAKGSKFVGCDFSNVVADRVIFDESDFTNAIFKNAVLSGASFDKANLKNTDFSDSYLGPFDLRNLCANPSLTGTNPTTNADSRESAGCL